MYDNLIRRLNEYSAEHENHGGITAEAADAIEELEMNYQRSMDARAYEAVRACIKTSDNVNHPSHYTQGGIECVEAIKASLGNADFASYCKGNVLKYLWRYRHKAGVEDLQKAKVYLDWMIQAEKEIQEANNAR